MSTHKFVITINCIFLIQCNSLQWYHCLLWLPGHERNVSNGVAIECEHLELTAHSWIQGGGHSEIKQQNSWNSEIKQQKSWNSEILKLNNKQAEILKLNNKQACSWSEHLSIKTVTFECCYQAAKMKTNNLVF